MTSNSFSCVYGVSLNFMKLYLEEQVNRGLGVKAFRRILAIVKNAAEASRAGNI